MKTQSGSLKVERLIANNFQFLRFSIPRVLERMRLESEGRGTSSSPELYKKYLSCLCAVTISCIVLTVTLLIHILRYVTLKVSSREPDSNEKPFKVPRGAKLSGDGQLCQEHQGGRHLPVLLSP